MPPLDAPSMFEVLESAFHEGQGALPGGPPELLPGLPQASCAPSKSSHAARSGPQSLSPAAGLAGARQQRRPAPGGPVLVPKQHLHGAARERLEHPDRAPAPAHDPIRPGDRTGEWRENERHRT